MEQTILTEAATGACSSRARPTRKADKTPAYDCLLGQLIVEPGPKARAKPGQGLARPSPVSWGAGLWRQP